MERIDGSHAFEVVMPDGAVYRIQSGRRGKGIELVPIKEDERRSKPGRPAKPSTEALREILATDAAKGRLQEPAAYVAKLIGLDPDLNIHSARSIVYREMRRFRGRDASGERGQRGRAPHPSTLGLRKRIHRDADRQRLKRPQAYVDWLAKQRPDATTSALRQIVYREIRAAKRQA